MEPKNVDFSKTEKQIFVHEVRGISGRARMKKRAHQYWRERPPQMVLLAKLQTKAKKKKLAS